MRKKMRKIFCPALSNPLTLHVFVLIVLNNSSLAQQNTATFNFTGSVQEWVVPPCVFEVCATVRGAKGGGVNGGNGATVNACFPVQPGQTLYLYVGGMGTQGANSGGWNGGGTGHASTGLPTRASFGGGGASDIRIGGTGLANRVIVAGGGGGRSGGSDPVCGGHANCNNGAPGCNTFGFGGGGGTQTAGGNGGAPWAGTPPGGQAGSLGQGGQGGFWQDASGGGGGGGLYGGGGGGNDGCCSGANGGGGGGGGSSLVPAGGTCQPANNSNHGQIILTWVGGGTVGGTGGPPMTISSTGPYCTGESIMLFASNSTASFYNWFGPNGFTSNLQNPIIPGGIVNSTYSGTYYLHYEENGCEDTLEIQVEVYDPVVPQFTQYQSYCQDAQIPALPTSSLNHSPLTSAPITGSWSPAINNQQTTTYLFTPDANQCALTTTMQITIIPNIVPQFTQLGPYCVNTPIAPLPTTSLDNISGTWSPQINNQDTTTYTFTPNPGECAYPTQMTIAIWPLVQPTFNQVAAVCQDANLAPLPTVSLPTILGSITGTWSPALNNQTTTTYTFTPDPGQCALNAQMTIQIWPRPLPTFQQDETVGCAPLRVFFENTTGFPNPMSCQWTMGNGNIINSCGNFVSSIYNAPGCYDVTLTMTYPGNCVNSFTATNAVCIEPDPVAAFSANPTQVEINQPVSFMNHSTGASTYQWTFGDFTGFATDVNPTHTYEQQGFYQVYLVAFSDFGCSDTASQAILVEAPVIYYVPNTFTPDNDQFNQTFKPIITQGIDIFGYQLLIFNRWGEILFESNDAEYGWDGTYGGKIVPDGTYIWKIRYRVLGVDKPQEIMGHVNLIR
jgi:gliding motility-associated-like protein